MRISASLTLVLGIEHNRKVTATTILAVDLPMFQSQTLFNDLHLVPPSFWLPQLRYLLQMV